MPAESKKQRRFMAMVEHKPASELSPRMRKVKREMTHQQLHDFAATSEKHLPDKVRSKKHHDRSERVRKMHE